MINLPLLYKRSTTNKIQTWEIIVEDNLIITRFGQMGGAIQETVDEIKQGKNIGKANSTTPELQAELEANAMFAKKLKKGYVTSLSEAMAGAVDAVITGGVEPMLAHTWDKQGHKMIWPCFVQPKLDGIRCIAVVPRRTLITLWTRTRKPITSMPHIIKELECYRQKEDIVLDGELYNHQYRDNFEQIVSLVRPIEPKENHDIVKYHLYDLVAAKQFEQRTEELHRMTQAAWDCVSIKFVETIKCMNESEARLEYARFMTAGYEGIMLRNSLSVYEHKRSYGLLKMKEMQDAEFEIVGVLEGRGKLMGCAGSFECATPNGDTFFVKMEGEHARLRELFKKQPIGQLLTVKFQNYTTDGIPRFPIGIRLREPGL